MVAYRNVETPGRQAVIVDTDAGPDDLIALAYLLEREDVQIDLIVSVNGVAHAEAGANNVARLLRAANRRIPVYIGQDQPLDGQVAFPEDWRTTADTLPGVTLPDLTTADLRRQAQQGPRRGPRPDMRRQPRPDGVNAILDRLRTATTPVRILALGPLTNIASVIQRDRKLLANISDIVVMGGAIDVPGNAPEKATSPVAEWNIYVDPAAAGIVFRSGIPITLVPLDATNQVPVDREFVSDFLARRRSVVGVTVGQLFALAQPMIDAHAFYAWDPLAAAVLTNPGIVRTRDMAIDVVHTGEEVGRLKVRDTDPNMDVAYTASAAEFREVFFGALTHGRM